MDVHRNALEEMILHTKQGKLWHFPVDNEQGNTIHTVESIKKRHIFINTPTFAVPVKWGGCL